MRPPLPDIEAAKALRALPFEVRLKLLRKARAMTGNGFLSKRAQVLALRFWRSRLVLQREGQGQP